MCGLFGFSGAEKVNLDKFKILALYNEVRGGDSTGVFINKKIIKNLGDSHKFLAVNKLINDDSDENVIFGHTRKSSSGVKSKDNAHPFSYVKAEKKDELHSAFAHNGTLHSWRVDLKKFGVKTEEYSVDSRALGMVIANKCYDALLDYDGSVTYLTYKDSAPNTLEVFKGASIEFHKMSADRPMFALRTAEGIYFSSLLAALDAIATEKDELIDIPVNEVLFFKNGELVESDTIPIARNKEAYTYSTYNSYVPAFSNKNNHNINSQFDNKKKETAPEQKENESTTNVKSFDFWGIPLTYSSNVFKGALYFNKGRYYRNGHLAHSFYRDENNVAWLNPYLVNKMGEYEKNGSEYYFFNGLIIKQSAVAKGEKSLIALGDKLTLLFSQAKTSNFNTFTASYHISKNIQGLFAFLSNELLDSRTFRVNIYENGTPLRFEGKVKCFLTKFARKITIRINNDNGMKCEIYDPENYESDFKILSEFVDTNLNEQKFFIGQSSVSFLNYTRCKNRIVTDLYINSLYRRLASSSTVDDDFEEDNEHLKRIDYLLNKNNNKDDIEDAVIIQEDDSRNDKIIGSILKLESDLTIIDADITFFMERIENGEYEELELDSFYETLDDLKTELEARILLLNTGSLSDIKLKV